MPANQTSPLDGSPRFHLRDGPVNRSVPVLVPYVAHGGAEFPVLPLARFEQAELHRGFVFEVTNNQANLDLLPIR